MSLAGASVEPGERPRELRYLARHDAAAGALVFAALTPPLWRLLAALPQFRGVLPPESYPALAPWIASIAMGPLWPPGRGPVLSHGFEGGAQVFVRRDLDRERDVAERVIAALGLDRAMRLEPFAYRIEGAQDALALLSDAARLEEPVTIEWAEDARPLTVAATVRSSAVPAPLDVEALEGLLSLR